MDTQTNTQSESKVQTQKAQAKSTPEVKVSVSSDTNSMDLDSPASHPMDIDSPSNSVQTEPPSPHGYLASDESTSMIRTRGQRAKPKQTAHSQSTQASSASPGPVVSKPKHSSKY